MAVYKVPQDVEADDKLIGPFSFRQFIYLIAAALGIFIAWILSRIFIGLFVIPLPLIIFFGALALPLRKDQPMETYLVAVVRFFLKPRIRLWKPDGQISSVTITAPQEEAVQLTKDFSGNEAERRLSYLAQIVDTQGWASRGVQMAPSSLADTVAAEAQHAHDVLDDDNAVGRSLTQLINQDEVRRKEHARAQLQPPAPVGAPQPAPQTVYDDAQAAQPATQQPVAGGDAPAATTQLDYDPYPTSMRQHVVLPASEQDKISAIHPSQPTLPASKPLFNRVNPYQKAFATQKQQKQAVTPSVSPDIIRLANNNDLSISAIAREAHRLQQGDGEEVVISLR